MSDKKEEITIYPRATVYGDETCEVAVDIREKTYYVGYDHLNETRDLTKSEATRLCRLINAPNWIEQKIAKLKKKNIKEADCEEACSNSGGIFALEELQRYIQEG